MENTTMMSVFHGIANNKTMLMERVRKHVNAKQIRQGIYLTRDSGAIRYASSMGVILYGSDSSIAERKCGIPVALMELQEAIFDVLEQEKCTQWPLWFLGVMTCGADLRPVVSCFFIWLLCEYETPVVDYIHRAEDREAVMEAVYLHRQRLESQKFERDEGIMKDWEPKMRKLIDNAKARGDNSAQLALGCAFFSLYARFSVGGAFLDALGLYDVTVDGEIVHGGRALTVSAAAKELLRLIGER